MEGNEAYRRDCPTGSCSPRDLLRQSSFFIRGTAPRALFVTSGNRHVNGRNTFVVAFAQIPANAHLTGTFQNSDHLDNLYSRPVLGSILATYRITRLYTELLAPMPELRVERETTNIDFNEVHFKQGKEALWLPASVTVTLDWNGKVLRNRHEYSDFKLFNVAASEKIGNPKEADVSSQAAQGFPETP